MEIQLKSIIKALSKYINNLHDTNFLCYGFSQGGLLSTLLSIYLVSKYNANVLNIPISAPLDGSASARIVYFFYAGTRGMFPDSDFIKTIKGGLYHLQKTTKEHLLNIYPIAGCMPKGIQKRFEKFSSPLSSHLRKKNDLLLTLETQLGLYIPKSFLFESAPLIIDDTCHEVEGLVKPLRWFIKPRIANLQQIIHHSKTADYMKETISKWSNKTQVY